MDFSTYQLLQFRRDGKVLYVTLNRPDQLNAFGEVMGPEVLRFFEEIASDPLTNVVVVTGAGRAFCSGGDLEGMLKHVADPASFQTVSTRSKRLVHTMLACPKILIARMNGHATGLGASLALLCDLVIAADHAKIGDPHVKVGLVAGDGGALLWPQLIGYARAKEYLLTGDLIPAPQAAAMGLINRAVPADELDATVAELAQRIANGPRRAIEWTKASINIGLRQLAQPIIEAAIVYEDLSAYTQDHAEAVHAFRDKRPPRFTGR